MFLAGLGEADPLAEVVSQQGHGLGYWTSREHPKQYTRKEPLTVTTPQGVGFKIACVGLKSTRNPLLNLRDKFIKVKRRFFMRDSYLHSAHGNCGRHVKDRIIWDTIV